MINYFNDENTSLFKSDDTARTSFVKNVITKTGINLHDIAFENDQAFEQFAHDNGFAIEKEVNLITYLDRLTCTKNKRLVLDSQTTDKILRGMKLYMLKPL